MDIISWWYSHGYSIVNQPEYAMNNAQTFGIPKDPVDDIGAGAKVRSLF